MRIIKPEFFLSKQSMPMGFRYPVSYVNFKEGELCDLDPWIFLDDKELIFYYDGLKERYPYRTIVPFASRLDDDEVACFDASVPSDDPKVFIIKDFESPGWELLWEGKNFLEWLELAKQESEEYKRYLQYGLSPRQEEFWYIQVYLPCEKSLKNFKYPQSYKEFISRMIKECEVPDLGGWKFFADLNKQYTILRKKYKKRKLVPILYKLGSDEVACFEDEGLSEDPSVVIIDTTAKSGEEVKEKYKTFSQWLALIQPNEEIVTE